MVVMPDKNFIECEIFSPCFLDTKVLICFAMLYATSKEMHA